MSFYSFQYELSWNTISVNFASGLIKDICKAVKKCSIKEVMPTKAVI